MKCKYRCVDKMHNVWQSECGHYEQFETDGPEENGWMCCPYCGKPIDEDYIIEAADDCEEADDE